MATRALSPSGLDRLLPWIVALVVLGPLGCLLIESVLDDAGRLDLSAYTEMYGDAPRLGRLLGTTLVVTGVTVAVAMSLGVPLGFLLARTDLAGRRWALALVVMGLLVPGPILIGGAMALAGHRGWLGTGLAQVLTAAGDAPALIRPAIAGAIQGLMMLPWSVLGSGVVLCLVEADLEDLGRIETSAVRVAWHVTTRRASPGLLAVALFVAALSFSEVAVTDVLLVRTFGEEAFTAYQVGGRSAATALGWVPLVVVLGMLGLGMALVRRWSAPGLDGLWRRGPRFRLGRQRWLVSGATWTALGLWWLPLVGALAWQTGRHVLTGPCGDVTETFTWSTLVDNLGAAAHTAWPELLCSAAAAVPGSLIATVLALAMAWHWRRRCVGGRLLVSCVLVLVAAPAAMLGAAWVRVASVPWVPAFLYDWGVVLAAVQALRSLPFACLLTWAAMKPIPDSLWEGAVLDGTGPVRALIHLVIPVVRAPVAAALLVSLVLCLGELGASHLAVPPGTPTLTIRVYTLLHYTMTELLAGMCLVQLAVVGTVVAGLCLIAGRAG